jgi:hypothetical protein
MYCVARQNKLETPKEKDEVNNREVHECDVRTRDPDASFFFISCVPSPFLDSLLILDEDFFF